MNKKLLGIMTAIGLLERHGHPQRLHSAQRPVETVQGEHAGQELGRLGGSGILRARSPLRLGLLCHPRIVIGPELSQIVHQLHFV